MSSPHSTRSSTSLLTQPSAGRWVFDPVVVTTADGLHRDGRDQHGERHRRHRRLHHGQPPGRARPVLPAERGRQQGDLRGERRHNCIAGGSGPWAKQTPVGILGLLTASPHWRITITNNGPVGITGATVIDPAEHVAADFNKLPRHLNP